MISLIVAFDNNRLIGSDNKLPWHYKEDLKYFKETTVGHDMLMGKNTFLSILSYTGKPLPMRHHFVLSKGLDYHHEQVTMVRDIQTFVNKYPKTKELFVIGGSSIYRQLLPYADRLYITHIDQAFTGDAYFPEIDFSQWQVLRENSAGDLTFAVYERRTSQ